MMRWKRRQRTVVYFDLTEKAADQGAGHPAECGEQEAFRGAPSMIPRATRGSLANPVTECTPRPDDGRLSSRRPSAVRGPARARGTAALG
jgi:hypothetical protein